MKKVGYILLICSALALTGCNNKISNIAETETTTEIETETTTKHSYSSSKKASDTSWSTILTSYVETTYDGIQSGKHWGEYILLSFTVKNVSYDESTNTVTCLAQFPTDDSTTQVDIKFLCNELPGYSPKDICIGDNIRACFYVDENGYFDTVSQGFSIIKPKSVEKTENTTPVETTQEVTTTQTETTTEEITTTQEESSTEEITTVQETTTSSAPANFTFMGKVKKDVTGNWRWSKVSTDLEPSDYAVYYYNTYFHSDDEIHAIINSKSNTTIRINCIADLNILDIGILNHIDHEENDAKVLFSGDLIEEYKINLTTGERIQED